MLLPLIKDSLPQAFLVEDKWEKNVHFDLILSKDYLFELIERQLVHSETDEIGKDGKECTIILAVCATRKLSKDGIVGNLEKSSIPFTAIENLFEEDLLGVFALESRQVLLSMRVWSHLVLVEGIDQLHALLDQLRILHLIIVTNNKPGKVIYHSSVIRFPHSDGESTQKIKRSIQG